MCPVEVKLVIYRLPEGGATSDKQEEPMWGKGIQKLQINNALESRLKRIWVFV